MTHANRLVGIVEYQAGNIHSIQSAFDYLGARTQLIAAAGDLSGVTHILLPGVGAFAHCAERLQASGLVPALQQAVFDEGTPLLGICVGMQLLADYGEELGGYEGLGWIGGRVRALEPAPGIRVPHVGWNDVHFEEDFGPYSAGDSADFYFDHSFAYHDPTRGRVIGSCEHGVRFAAIVRSGNIAATQFHPEKSQAAGLKLLEGFLAMEPAC